MGVHGVHDQGGKMNNHSKGALHGRVERCSRMTNYILGQQNVLWCDVAAAQKTPTVDSLIPR